MILFKVKFLYQIRLFALLATTIYFFVTAHDLDSHPNWNLIDKKNCGTARAQSRIVGGIEAEMGTYPWLALLGYAENPGDEIFFHCGGVLINRRYVLSAAHCITVMFDYERRGVRLGEHDLKHNPDCQTIDCVGEKCRKYCADTVQNYKPEEMIMHKSYNNPNLHNDIALIRLDKNVSITDWVKPICLPYGKILTKDFVGKVTEVGGWGSTSACKYNDKEGSNILLHLHLRVMNNKDCEKIYKDHPDLITDNVMCAGGIENEDTCAGDSGGPLMTLERSGVGKGMPRYFVLGMVSFGESICGSKGRPGVYTRVTKYMNWVLDNIKP